MTGELIGGRYQVERELGRGAMGVVYLAQDTRLPRQVALKMLDAELTGDANLRLRLEQEARAAAALNHPGIATVYDFDRHQGASFIVFEFVEGVRLLDRIQQGRLSTELLLDIGAQLADALSAAHDRGIVHRDLKPANVMLAPGSQGGVRVKILDFGLAKLREPLQSQDSDSAETVGVVTGAGLVVGTINYMSPEQLGNDPVDGRADLFALGLLLYEMAAGAHPFAGKTVSSTIANIMKQEAPPLAGHNPAAPAELDRILRKLLRKRREERHASARDLFVDLNNLRRELATGVASPDPPPAAPPVDKPVPPGPGSGIFARGPARAVFSAIQAGYLAMYLAALVNLGEALDNLAVFFGEKGVGPRTGAASLFILMTALAGIAVRLYLFSAVAADYPGFGSKYRVLFPFLFVADLFWALAPLLLHPLINMGVTLAAMAALAYLPFVQRRLVYDAYLPRGGRTSAVRVISG
jgi:tRNA A-37 threonylcarbamoyl transferase component Bud32